MYIHDDFGLFCSLENEKKWEMLNSAFTARGYHITITTNKPFVGLNIEHYNNGSYNMPQHQSIKKLLAEMNMSACEVRNYPTLPS